MVNNFKVEKCKSGRDGSEFLLVSIEIKKDSYCPVAEVKLAPGWIGGRYIKDSFKFEFKEKTMFYTHTTPETWKRIKEYGFLQGNIFFTKGNKKQAVKEAKRNKGILLGYCAYEEDLELEPVDGGYNLSCLIPIGDIYVLWDEKGERLCQKPISYGEYDGM